MAFGRLERPQGSQPMSEINMTPLIDVMLVLLVIFMLTAPLMTSRLKLDLPKAPAPSAEPAPATFTVALTADGLLHLDDTVVTVDVLRAQAKAQAEQKPDTEVQLRADKVVPYGQVAELIGLLQQAGLNRIAFVTEGPQGEAAAAP
ncbi:biopolymer transporter ExbD [Aquabacterium olei]|uniref:Biopolymer transporter ExbD n=1 Tax=Aquabacterium olei TaxID=1296669 RepID=A0A2U8FN49_9BURK|nr:biopolymer transporter ExbD [Aquabacterium olei]AWI52347.1 biopolymer transporter ExbD [Aquabacterium olei]